MPDNGNGNGNGNSKSTLAWYVRLLLPAGATVLAVFLIWAISQPFVTWTRDRKRIERQGVAIETHTGQIALNAEALLLSQERQNKAQETIIDMQHNIHRTLEILTEYKDLSKTLWDHNARLTQLEKTEGPDPMLVREVAETRAAIERIKERMEQTERAMYQNRRETQDAAPNP